MTTHSCIKYSNGQSPLSPGAIMARVWRSFLTLQRCTGARPRFSGLPSRPGPYQRRQRLTPASNFAKHAAIARPETEALCWGLRLPSQLHERGRWRPAVSACRWHLTPPASTCSTTCACTQCGRRCLPERWHSGSTDRTRTGAEPVKPLVLGTAVTTMMCSSAAWVSRRCRSWLWTLTNQLRGLDLHRHRL